MVGALEFWTLDIFVPMPNKRLTTVLVITQSIKLSAMLLENMNYNFSCCNTGISWLATQEGHLSTFRIAFLAAERSRQYLRSWLENCLKNLWDRLPKERYACFQLYQFMWKCYKPCLNLVLNRHRISTKYIQELWLQQSVQQSLCFILINSSLKHDYCK